MDIIKNVVESSTIFEQTNTRIKKDYLIKNINIFNDIARKVPGYKGFFGVGYPFYAFINNSDRLPIIDEQIRYNNELLDDAKKNLTNDWYCKHCLHVNAKKMPNLKIICKRCQNMIPNLKPRKIITRIPDMDLWIIIDGDYKKAAKDELVELLIKNNIYTSDIDPIKTFDDFYEITIDIKNNKMPQKYLPIDVHIIEYSRLYKYIENVVLTIDNYLNNNKIPYMPIVTEALRKKWQYDEEACDFIHDFLYSFTEYDFDENLTSILKKSRKELVEKYSTDQLYKIVLATGKPLVTRRQKNTDLQNNFNERINAWKKL